MKKIAKNFVLSSLASVLVLSCTRTSSVNQIPNFYEEPLQTNTSTTLNQNSTTPITIPFQQIEEEKELASFIHQPIMKSTAPAKYQDILTSWDTDKTDKGLTIKEIKENVDRDNDKNITIEELLKAGLTEEEANLVLKRFKEYSNNDSNLAFELVELDARVFPGGISKVSESDIQQGKRNVCYFLSGLAGLALHRREKDILNLIEKNRDGSFTVTFAGVKKEKNWKVNFPNDNDLNKLIFRGKNGSAWVAIVVNAYTLYAQKGGRPFKHIFAKTYVSDYGLTWEGIEVQNKKRALSYLLDFYNTDKLLNGVKKALDDKKVVTIDTFLKGNISTPLSPKKNEFKFSRAHILTVTGVDFDKKELIIRDPYGKYNYYDEKGKEQEHTETDGFMHIPVSNIKKYFLDLSIESEQEGSFEGVRTILDRFL